MSPDPLPPAAAAITATGPVADDAPEVLVVDDNPVTRYATDRVLRHAGFRVVTADSGHDALALAHPGTAAVVLDVHLPDIDGFEVCRRLRARPDTALAAVIHLSAAHVSAEDKVRGLEGGADAYITHPAEPPMLVATLRALLRARAVEDARRRSEAKFRAIHDLASIGIGLVDAEGRVVDANPALLALLGRERAEVVGRPLSEFAAADRAERVRASATSHDGAVWHAEFPLSRADGSLAHVKWSVSPHVEPGIALAVATDISERVALERQRERLLEREQAARSAAERLGRAKDDFIAVLSHELRTPINAIVTWAHVLSRQELAPEVKRGIEAIHRNARTQTRLISDILDVSSLDVGKLRLEPVVADPAAVLRDAINGLAPAFDEKGLVLETDIAPGLPPTWLDPARFQQIAWNLLSNALKFTTAPGRVSVSLRREGHDGPLRLSVADEGRGISPPFLDQLFDRFTQADSSLNRHHGGLGLGLSIVKQLAELHGGQVAARSDGPGCGATFEVTLPAGLPPEGGAGEREPSRPAAAAPALDDDDASVSSSFGREVDLHGLDVLVVDDDTEAAGMLALILGDRGARVWRAGSVEDALLSVEAHRPDVVVSDIGMPGRDGYELAREIRRREHDAQDTRGPLRLVALTAFAREGDRAMAMEAGFDAHCAKPLKPHELMVAVRGGDVALAGA